MLISQIFIGKTRGLQEKRGSNMMGFMSMKSAPEEKIAAESFITSFPYFVRVMKKFNVGGSYTLVSSSISYSSLNGDFHKR